MSELIIVSIKQIQCPKKHLFFPKINSSGKIIIPTKCPIRNCRMNLISKRRYRTKEEILKQNRINAKKCYKKNKLFCKKCEMQFSTRQGKQLHDKRRHWK